MILREATIKYAGYDPDKLKRYSKKRVCVRCENLECKNPIRWVNYNNYRDLCVSCSQKNGYKEKIILNCKQCGKEFEVIPSLKNKRFYCCRKCVYKWSSINLVGENNLNYGSKRTDEQKANISKNHWDSSGSNNPAWKGGIANIRKHVLPENKCRKINIRFEGSEFHHLTKSIGVYIPKELHRHLYHSLLNNINMDEMSILAFQYIKGEL